jgi:glycosyltransferase involved in cell wall biosynthesis
VEQRVLIDGNVLGRQRTGDETYVENLIRELAGLDLGFRITVATAYPDRLPTGVEPLLLSGTRQAQRLLFRMPEVLRRIGPSLAHFQYVIPPRTRVPAVVTVHDVSFADHRFSPIYDRIALRALVPPSMRRARAVLTVSEWSKEQLVERFRLPPERVIVTPNGVDPAFGPNGPAIEGDPYVLFVGAIEPRKDPLAAVRALSLLDEGTRLVMVGPPKRSIGSLRALIAELGLGGSVDLRGYVEKGELASLYRGAMCLLLPSRYEGFGLPVVEAMACGTPVVATHAGAIPEVAGDAAMLVDSADPGTLAEAIRIAHRERARLRDAGLARAKMYTWAETARLTARAYEAAMS